MKEVVERALVRLGVERPVREVWRVLKANGLMHWNPLVPEEAVTACVSNALSILREHEGPDELGDYLEFGVSRGTSLACVYHALENENLSHVRLIGFDSFQGMPPGSDEEGWREGAFHSSLAATRRYLESRHVDLGRVTLVEGWFNDTLNPKTRADLKLAKASLIMVDCDIYSASKEALAFCEPHIKKHAVIMFDDWGPALAMGKVGQKEIFEEFLADHPDVKAEPLPAYNDESRVFLLRRLRS